MTEPFTEKREMMKTQSPNIVRRLWMLPAAIALILAFPGAAHAAGGARASATAASLHIAQLCAQTTEDVGTDEIYLKKNGSTAWGPRSINQGSCTRNIYVNVANGDVITLYDQDNPAVGDSDDWLGTITINSVGEYHFTGDGAFYKMWTEN